MVLDKLQGENNCYLATLMPTVMQIHKKLQTIKLTCQLSDTDTLVNAILKGIETRFPNLLNFTRECRVVTVAAVAHPNFKMPWVTDENKEWVRAAFFKQAKKCILQSEKPVLEGIGNKDCFFDFEEDTNSENAGESEESLVTLECLRYLEEKPTNDLQTLSRYPTVKSLFIKLNAAIPSSAPVEQLFSKAVLICSPKKSLER